MTKCKYGDPTCPCQDGDPCHYEGAQPMNVPAEYVRHIIAEKVALLYALRWLTNAVNNVGRDGGECHSDEFEAAELNARQVLERYGGRLG